jgi:hypothetical protein
MGHRGGTPGLEWQRGLGAVQRLDLALLVHAQHHGLLGRVEVEPDHVDELLLEPWVTRDLEGLHQVGLEAPG